MNSNDEFYLDEESSEWIGLKKSEYLSTLIMNLSADDFQFEEFIKYDEYIPQTIENPDRKYMNDEDTFKVQTLIRSYEQGVLFHQVVIGGLIPDQNTKTLVFVPILTFVTRKDELLKIFCVGRPEGLPTLN